MRAIAEPVTIEFDLVDEEGNVFFTTYALDQLLEQYCGQTLASVVMRAWSRDEGTPPTPTIDITQIIRGAMWVAAEAVR